MHARQQTMRVCRRALTRMDRRDGTPARAHGAANSKRWWSGQGARNPTRSTQVVTACEALPPPQEGAALHYAC